MLLRSGTCAFPHYQHLNNFIELSGPFQFQCHVFAYLPPSPPINEHDSGLHLISVARRVILRTNNKPTTLPGTLVDCLNNVNKLLLVFQQPIHLVVISRAKIAHHMLVAVEEHDRKRVVQLVHCIEVGHLVEITQVDDGKVFDAVGDAVEDFVLRHAVFVPVAPKRITTRRSSSDMIAWSTCQPETRWGRMTEPMMSFWLRGVLSHIKIRAKRAAWNC